MLRALFLSLVLALPMAPAGAAEDPKLVMWEDLVPQFEPMDNPFDKLDPNVLEDLRIVELARYDLKMGFIEESGDEYQNAMALERALMEKGVDVKGLTLAAEEMQAEIERRNAAVVPALDGKLVRMPGYALPLEQSPDGVTEFLLVPYVGACIHTPPPPPNQIVYVRLAQAYTVENLYEPVWITGTISAEASSRQLSFVDGQAPVETGYKLDGLAVEPYR